jgi:hypothetical protein
MMMILMKGVDVDALVGEGMRRRRIAEGSRCCCRIFSFRGYAGLLFYRILP